MIRPQLTATILVAWMPTACVSMAKRDLAQATDYAPSTSLAHSGRPDAALKHMPSEEKGGFVTTVEKGWLGVLAGTADPAPLVELGQRLEERKTIRVSGEATSYFYKESNDGYFPAEHEAIALHLTTGMAFLQQDDCKGALVEARRAARYLQGAFDDTQAVAFDDPAMRVWLAGLWASCGEWGSARTDLRRAAALDKTLTWAKRLAEQKQPPRHFTVILAGTGPMIDWDPEAEVNALRGLSNLKFIPAREVTPLQFTDIGLVQGVSTIAWYARHQERDFAIRDILGDSKYAVDVSAASVAAGGVGVLGATAAVAVFTAGVAGGLYLAKVAWPYFEVLGGDLGFFLLIPSGLLIYGGTVGALAILDTTSDASGTIVDKAFNNSEFYRFVRFLPEAVYGYGGDVPLAGDARYASLTMRKAGETSVSILFDRGDVPYRRLGAMRAIWEDQKNHKLWALLTEPVTLDVAHRACEGLPGNYRMATWQDIQDGKNAGMETAEINRPFARILNDTEKVWTSVTVPTDGRPGKCRVTYLEDMSEALSPDCSVSLPLLCVSAL